MSRRGLFVIVSLGLHGAVLWGYSFLGVERAEFGVQIAESSVEVSLTAAASPIKELKTETPAAPELMPETVPPPAPPEPDDLIMPIPLRETIPPPPVPAPEPIKPQPVTPLEKAGHDIVTLTSSSGTPTPAQPDYLRNPPPAYPENARCRGMEGLTVLICSVDPAGRCLEVKIRASSGYTELDAAALKSVPHWRFRPATLGGLPVFSQVEVPIRFNLKK